MDYIQTVKNTIANDYTEEKPSSNNNQQIKLFERQIFLNKQKIHSLEKEVEQLREIVKKNDEAINKLLDSEVVARKREALHSRRENPPSEKPIDRNGVAPKDVQIRNIFYAGRR